MHLLFFFKITLNVVAHRFNRLMQELGSLADWSQKEKTGLGQLG